MWRDSLFEKVAKIVDPEDKLPGEAIIKLVEEKFTSTNSSVMPCPEFTDGFEWCHLGFKGINCGFKPCGLARHN